MDQDWRPFDSLHKCWHNGILHENRQGSPTSQIVRRNGLFRLTVSHHHGSKFLSHIFHVCCQCENGHDFAGHRNVKARFTTVLDSWGSTFTAPRQNRFLFAHTHHDGPQMPIARIQYPLPRNGVYIKIKTSKLAALLGRQILWWCLGINAQFDEAFLHDGRESLGRKSQASIECFVTLCILVKNARVNGGGEQVVGGRDGVNVARQVQVEFLHGNYLCVPTSRSTALDTKRGTLRGLSNTGKGALAQGCSQGLRQSNRGGGLAFTERRRIDPRANHIIPTGTVLQPLLHTQRNLRLGNAPLHHLFIQQARLPGDIFDRK
mmetsp:Transcript_20034/g.36376  ORF Transcript_20034/g.36376 Transcript_20034/m.36376 type:complete len:319 (+) Transcript_20034:1064-2020(+)